MLSLHFAPRFLCVTSASLKESIMSQIPEPGIDEPRCVPTDEKLEFAGSVLRGVKLFVDAPQHPDSFATGNIDIGFPMRLNSFSRANLYT